jgi:hypothetical protein
MESIALPVEKEEKLEAIKKNRSVRFKSTFVEKRRKIENCRRNERNAWLR